MKVVWKYQFPAVGETIGVPSHGHIVHVGLQDGKVTVWAEVDGSGVGYVRHLVIIGTGQPIPDQYVHVGTALLPPFVWHVYATHPEATP